MRLVILALLFLFCNGNVAAIGKNRDSEILTEKTRVMMDEINRILRDFYDSVKHTPSTHSSEIKRSHGDVYPKLYGQSNKTSDGSIYNLEQQKHHGENMRMFYDLRTRYDDLQKHSQEVKALKEQWVNSKYDKSAYQRYAEEQKKHIEALDAYKQDVNKHNEMKKMLRGG
jgi:hypothetical protein